MSDTERKAATSIEVVDLHLDYLRRDVAKLVEAMGNMATRDDIARIEGQLSRFATKDDLRQAEERWQGGSVQSTFDRWLSAITRLGSAFAVIAAGAAAAVALVHFLDRVPK